MIYVDVSIVRIPTITMAGQGKSLILKPRSYFGHTLAQHGGGSDFQSVLCERRTCPDAIGRVARRIREGRLCGGGATVVAVVCGGEARGQRQVRVGTGTTLSSRVIVGRGVLRGYSEQYYSDFQAAIVLYGLPTPIT